MYADGVSLSLQSTLLKLLGVQVVHVLSLINALAIKIPLSLVGDILQQLLTNPNVVAVVDDMKGEIDYTISITPAEPPESEEFSWAMKRVRFPEAQEMTTPPGEDMTVAGEGVTVAVLDTGIDLTHTEFLNLNGQTRIVGGFNALPGGGSAADDNGHGTHVAGIIGAALNHSGVIGGAPLVKLVPVKVLDRNGAAHSSDAINGMQYAYSRGYPVLNMSFGFPASTLALERAVERLCERGMIMIASVGNTNPRPSAAGEGGDSTCEPTAAGEGGDTLTTCYQTTNVKYPAAYPCVIGVAATEFSQGRDQVANYSRAGTEVDVAGPGGSAETGQILSTHRGGIYGFGSGTSQAAAHVTAAVVIALQWQPELTFEDILALLQGSARDLGEPRELQGAGMLDVRHLLEILP